MNQAVLTHLVSKLPIKVAKNHRKFKNVEGIYGRLKIMRATLTGLIQHERLELNYHRADEARGYAERLISDAIRYGDCHRPTMNQAKFWLLDPALVPKLFKVLAPRYENWAIGLPYTRLLRAPSNPTELNKYSMFPRTVLELRGNPYPPLPGPMGGKKHPGLIHNVLLEEARKDFFKSLSPEAQQVETLIQSIPDEVSKHLNEEEDDVDEEANTEILMGPTDSNKPSS